MNNSLLLTINPSYKKSKHKLIIKPFVSITGNSFKMAASQHFINIVLRRLFNAK